MLINEIISYEGNLALNIFLEIINFNFFKDPIDAVEKFKNLELRGPEERELINVCLRCSMLEADYNPYYAQIINLLCVFKKRFQVTLKFFQKFCKFPKMDFKKFFKL